MHTSRTGFSDTAALPLARPDTPAAPSQPGQWALRRVRAAIDQVDDGLIVLLAARGRLVRTAAVLKSRIGLPARDPGREQRVRARGARLARRIGCPESSAQRVLDLAIGDACRQQGVHDDLAASPDPDQGATPDAGAMMVPAMPSDPRARLLRLLPPPGRLAPLLRRVPARWQHRLLEAMMARVLDAPLRDGTLDFLRGRLLAIEVTDLRLCWLLTLEQDRLRVTGGEAEACVRGTATDLLLLAGRLEDADTLFFQRRLVLSGDTELGLTARNMLERLPWASIPLGLRIALNRGARLARAARQAHRHEAA